jgi:D-citramalate synthase
MKIEIMDTTLRDGEQTSGIAFTDTEKLNIAKMLLDEVNVDRIEVASARISYGEFEAVRRIVDYAGSKGFLSRVEVLGFVDEGRSLDWIYKSGARVINLLCKGSLKHVTSQLNKTPEEHLANIITSIRHAESLGIAVNVYFEDWSNGMRNSPDYLYFMLDNLKDQPIVRFMLPDTLGILNPFEMMDYATTMIKRYPNLHFDVHTHNDYDLSVANALAAVKAGFRGVHTTVNGLGERAGNAPLSSMIAVLNDHFKANLSVNEFKLNKISKMVETFSGIKIPANKPLVGENVFTQTCGVHADGDNKDKLYYNDLMPERFGRTRQYALGKTSGKASIKHNLLELGIELDPEIMKKVTQRVVELGDKKEFITKEDLPFIIADVLGNAPKEEKIKIKNYYTTHVYNLKPVASVSILIGKQVYEATSTGDGQYDAFMQALKKIYDTLRKRFPKLNNYAVRIPPGGRTDALVETIITWELDYEFKTRGLDSDQTTAAIKATIKMLNLLENMAEKIEHDNVEQPKVPL